MTNPLYDTKKEKSRSLSWNFLCFLNFKGEKSKLRFCI